MRRSAGFSAAHADELRAIVLHGSDDAFSSLIPPFISKNAVPIRVSAAQKGRVARRGARVGVIVVTIGEIRSVIKKEAESAFAELVAITLQVVATKLIDYDNDDQLGAGIIGGRKAQAGEPEEEKSKNETATGGCHRAGSLQCVSFLPKHTLGSRNVMLCICGTLGHSITGRTLQMKLISVAVVLFAIV